MTFADVVDFLTAERARQGRSQREVALSLGLTQAAVSMYESRARRGSLDWLQAWAAALGYDLVIELRKRTP